MRVLHVYRTFFPDTQGGLEEVVRQICKNTAAHGVESRVFCLSHHPEPAVLEFDGIPVYRARCTLEIASCDISLSALGLFKELVAWADIVHYQFPWPFADLLHLVAGVKKPTVLTYQSDIVRQQSLLKLYRPLKRRFLQQMSAIVATSPNYVATSAVLQHYATKVRVIPIGVDEASYPQVDEKAIENMQLRVGKDFFLFIGVLRYYKGLHTLLEAVKNSDWSVVIVGRGPEEANLKAQAENLGLKNVQFLGYVSNEEKVALLKLAKALVFPSHLRSEAFGVSLLEGAMYGKPLISCEIGTGTSFVNADGETGFVVPPENPLAFRAAMEKLQENQPLVEKFGQAARARYERLFTGQKMGADYAALYQSLLI
jgi:glycosyltransferase involved in cell wall biosynthesis